MDDIEQVRAKTDIVELVSSYIPLKKAGRNYKALCPFHGEKTPSFVVSPELQIFKCFGCSESGNVFSFVQKLEGMTFGEALRFLAQKAGITLSRYRPTREEQDKDQLLSINHLAAEFYHYLLVKHRVGQKARQYLTKRGISPAAVETFNLGYAPGLWEGLQRYLVQKKGYRSVDLERTGLILKGQSGWYDRFRGRVMFPLHDHRGHVVGFAGRIIDQKEAGAKYVNTPETVLYHKSDLLYGLYQNREAIKKAQRCVLVEGELDMISSWQAGVKNVAAIKGSALTENQVNLIKRFAGTVALALDADLAGDKATRRGIEIAERAGLVVTVINLPTAPDPSHQTQTPKDPDDIARQDPGLWRRLTQKGQVIYDFYLTSAIGRFGAGGGMAKKRITDELLPLYDRIDNEVVKSHYLKKLSQAIDISEEVLLRQMAKLASRKPETVFAPAPAAKTEEKSQEERLLEYLLALILQSAHPCSVLKQLDMTAIGIPKYEKIVAFIRQKCAAAGPKSAVSALTAGLPEELQPTTNTLFLYDIGGIENKPDRLDQEIRRIQAQLHSIQLKKRQAAISDRIAALEKEGRDQAEITRLQAEFVELTRRLTEQSAPDDDKIQPDLPR